MIKVLDFEQVAVCYKPYVDAITELETKGNKLREELTSMQEEAMSLMNPEGEQPDEATMAENQQKFQSLQQEAMLKDKNFKMEAQEEQRKIANGLSSLDNIIKAETEKLCYLKDHKKGLMQQLLTGKVRVNGLINKTMD